MKNTTDIKQKSNGIQDALKQKSGIVTNQIDAFLEECKLQKRFFSGQMSIEDYIGMKKKTKNNLNDVK
jgi:hypothetical protein